jgi:hypothetical protein
VMTAHMTFTQLAVAITRLEDQLACHALADYVEDIGDQFAEAAREIATADLTRCQPWPQPGKQFTFASGKLWALTAFMPRPGGNERSRDGWLWARWGKERVVEFPARLPRWTHEGVLTAALPANLEPVRRLLMGRAAGIPMGYDGRVGCLAVLAENGAVLRDHPARPIVH